MVQVNSVNQDMTHSADDISQQIGNGPCCVHLRLQPVDALVSIKSNQPVNSLLATYSLCPSFDVWGCHFSCNGTNS